MIRSVHLVNAATSEDAEKRKADGDESVIQGTEEGVPHQDLGRNFNTLTGQGYSTSVLADGWTHSERQDDQSGTSFVSQTERVESSLELRYGLSASAEADAFGYRAAVSWTKSRKLTSTALHMVHYTSFTTYRQTLPTKVSFKPEVAADAEAMLAGDFRNLFFRRYGDAYCSEVLYGGLLYALVTYHTRDAEEASALSVRLGLNKGPVEASGDFEESVQQVEREYETDIAIYHNGLDITDAPQTVSDVLKIVGRFKSLVKAVGGRGNVVERRFLPFVSVPGIDAIRFPFFDGEALFREIKFGCENLLASNRVVDQIRDALRHPERYRMPDGSPFDPTEWRATYNRLRTEGAALMQRIDLAQRNPTMFAPGPQSEIQSRLVTLPIDLPVAYSIPLTVTCTPNDRQNNPMRAPGMQGEWVGMDGNAANTIGVEIADPRLRARGEIQMRMCRLNGPNGPFVDTAIDEWRTGPRNANAVVVGLGFRLPPTLREEYDLEYSIRYMNGTVLNGRDGQELGVFWHGTHGDPNIPTINAIKVSMIHR